MTVPDGWVWTLYTATCEDCGAENSLHELPPDMLEEGDIWECSTCGHKHQRGGRPDIDPALLLECGGCGATYTGDAINDLDAKFTDGGVTWTDPVCGTVNKQTGVAETAGVKDGAKR